MVREGTHISHAARAVAMPAMSCHARHIVLACREVLLAGKSIHARQLGQAQAGKVGAVCVQKGSVCMWCVCKGRYKAACLHAMFRRLLVCLSSLPCMLHVWEATKNAATWRKSNTVRMEVSGRRDEYQYDIELHTYIGTGTQELTVTGIL